MRWTGQLRDRTEGRLSFYHVPFVPFEFCTVSIFYLFRNIKKMLNIIQCPFTGNILLKSHRVISSPFTLNGINFNSWRALRSLCCCWNCMPVFPRSLFRVERSMAFIGLLKVTIMIKNQYPVFSSFFPPFFLLPLPSLPSSLPYNRNTSPLKNLRVPISRHEFYRPNTFKRVEIQGQ